MQEIEKIYARLNISFDYQHGESFYHAMLPDVVDDLAQKQILRPSQGALIYNENESARVSVVRKKDGAFTYTATDLATIKYRYYSFSPYAILYVVDFRQADHFKNLFACAKSWGYGNIDLQHISFGSVLDENGRPIKTRDGNAVQLHDLLDEAVHEARRLYELNRLDRMAQGEEIPEFSKEEIDRIAHVVGIGAVKYADLSQNRTTDYRFSLKKMLSMEGNTSTYMQYAYVRCKGILRKSGLDFEKFAQESVKIYLNTAEERRLVLKLLQWEDTVVATAKDYSPHYLCAYLWDLAGLYNQFFVHCPVLPFRDDKLQRPDFYSNFLHSRSTHPQSPLG